MSLLPADHIHRHPEPISTDVAQDFATDLVAGIAQYLQHAVVNRQYRLNSPEVLIDLHDEELLLAAAHVAVRNRQHILTQELNYPASNQAVGLALLAMIRGMTSSHYENYSAYYLARDIITTMPQLTDTTFLIVTSSVQTYNIAYVVLDEIPRNELQQVLASTQAPRSTP